MAYTTEEFDRVRREVDRLGHAYSPALSAALLIAARVMKPGVTDAAVDAYWKSNDRETDLSDESEAAAIRKALADA